LHNLPILVIELSNAKEKIRGERKKMIFYYVRHGDPIYNPDSLTDLGHKQAEALSKRFQLYGLDEIYSSTSIRAQMTAQPTCKALKKEKILLDWAHENVAWERFTVDNGEGGRTWVWHSPEYREKLNDPSVRALGFEWYKHPHFKDYDFGNGIKIVDKNVDLFFEQLGFKHDRENSCYKVIKKNSKRVALFAHEGFGKAFLSSVLDIPYPWLSTHLDIGHSGVTVLHFDETAKKTYPRVLQWSNDSHLYKENILTGYHNTFDI
jgi:probable phosphoglycerate mutase